MKVAVVVGRFQVPELTDGHERILVTAERWADHVLVLLGVAPTAAPTKRNPLSFMARKALIEDWRDLWNTQLESLLYFPRSVKPVTILPLYDMRDNVAWVSQIDGHISRLFPGSEAKLYGSRDSCLPLYRNNGGRFDVDHIATNGSLSGTSARASVLEGASVSFCEGVIWATQKQFAGVFPVVDMAIFRGENILLARKADDEPGRWRLIGGFVDGSDDSYEAAASREVREETGLEVSKPIYVGSCSIDDWRFRGGPETVKSSVFAMEYVFGNAKANDDIAELQWFDIPVATRIIAPIHREALMKALDWRFGFPKQKTHTSEAA